MKKTLAAILAALLGMHAFACAAGWPIVVMDQAKREVVIRKEPETIASGYFIATSMLIALDQADKLVGVENDAQNRPVYTMSAPQLLDLPALGTVKTFDLETCAMLNPDLVVLPLRLLQMADPLEQLGLTVLFVNPESEELLRESISLLGEATGSGDRAQGMIRFIDEKLEELRAAVADAEEPLVYFSGNSSFLNTAGPAMYQHRLIENAGAVNAAKDFADTYWAASSYEQLLAWNPDVIVMAADAKYTPQSVLEDKNLAACSAVATGRVYRMPRFIESWDAPVPGSFLGSLWMASKLHPQQYGEGEYEAAVISFYERFYGFTPVF